MVETIIRCDLCKTKCTDEPYGVTFGRLNDPAKHVRVQLCKKHYQDFIKGIKELSDKYHGQET